MAAPDPAFLIVGTARSGTTLVQRLAAELPGVAVPPETHFFAWFDRALRAPGTFPLSDPDLSKALQAYAALPLLEGLGLEPAAVATDLGGHAERPADLFGAVVRSLTPEAEVRGEKTPAHLLWWRPLIRAIPGLKLVAVVRDPRAVAASYLALEWTKGTHLDIAERWRLDQREVAAARRALGPGRSLVLRYEEVVGDPDAARRWLAAFLGVRAEAAAEVGVTEVGAPRLHLPHETWKERAAGPVSTERIEAWRESLTEAQALDVASVCRREMGRLGYGGAPSAMSALLRLARLSPAARWRRLRARAGRRAARARIGRVRL